MTDQEMKQWLWDSIVQDEHKKSEAFWLMKADSAKGNQRSIFITRAFFHRRAWVAIHNRKNQ